MTQQEIQKQIQKDILSILEGLGIVECLNEENYKNLKIQLCDCIIDNFKKLKNECL